jgi:hypothetical protein
MAQGLNIAGRPSAPVIRASTGVVALIFMLAAAGFALTVLVFFPGYLTNDASYVYQFMRDWQFGDWQSPLMSMLWWVIDPISPGPGSMFLLVAFAYWLGFALVGLALARRSALLGLVVPLIALTPPSVMMLGMIWRDMLFAVTWLLAAAIVLVMADRGHAARAIAAVVALALIGFGVLLRPTSFVAAPLLVGYALWPLRFDVRRMTILFLPALAAGFLLIHLVYYVILDVKRENPLHSVFVFDLGGITHFSGENQFPVTWSADETELLTSRCYNPDRWDTYWTLEPCRFVMARLERPDDVIFGTPRLTEAWKQAVTTQPLAYLRHRLTFFWHFLSDPDTLTFELYKIDDPSQTPLARNNRFKAAVALHNELKQTVLFRPGFWLILAGMVVIAAMPARTQPAGAFAIAVAGSATIYVLTFLPFGVAADFRYGYWCVPACLVAAAALFAAYRERSPDAPSA